MTDIEQYKAILAGETAPLIENLTEEQKVGPDFNRWTGKVTNNDDPEKLGRCQIQIIGYYENIPKDKLPWAHPDITYMGSKCGGQIIPEVDSMVRGYFEKGDVQRPIYDSIAFNEYNAESSFTDRKTDYPHKLVLFETDNGDFLTLNRKDGTLVFTHRTGAMFQIDKDGNVQMNNGTGSDKTMNITCNGDLNLNVSGNVTVSGNGNITADCTGNIEFGRNPSKTSVCNTPFCFICGAKHSTQDQVLV